MRFASSFRVVAYVTVFLSGCGGGGGGSGGEGQRACASALHNGATPSTVTSVWRCSGPASGEFDFVLFADGHGQSSAIGEFSWTEQTCGTVAVSASVPQTITNIQIASDLGSGSFTTTQANGSDSISCTRQASVPDERQDHVIAYLSDTQKIVMFGGSVSFGTNSKVISDTWEFDGAAWSQINQAPTPPAMFRPAMAYDHTRNVAVLFGSPVGGSTTETWEYKAGQWSQRTFSISPPVRSYHAMTFDSLRNVMVVFGGRNKADGGGSSIYDTWEYDGVEWVERPSSSDPCASGATPLTPCMRYGALMAYDQSRARSVLHGQVWQSGAYVSGTYEWDGSVWTEALVPGGSLPGNAATMTYDKNRQVTVLANPPVANYSPRIWEWNGASWTDTLQTFPQDGAMVFHDALGQAVLVGRAMRVDIWNGTTITNVWSGP